MALAGILLFPVMAPVWGIRFVIDRLREEAEANLRDEGRGFAELIELSMRRSAGKISEEEFADQEAALLDRLSAIREAREELLNDAVDLDDEESYEVELLGDGDELPGVEEYPGEYVLPDAGTAPSGVQS